MVWYSGFPKNSSLKWFLVLIKKASLCSCNTWQTGLKHSWFNHSLPPLFHHAIRKATASICVSECACNTYFAEFNVLKGAWILTQYTYQVYWHHASSLGITFVSVSLFEEYIYYFSNLYNYAPHRAKLPFTVFYWDWKELSSRDYLTLSQNRTLFVIFC